MQNPIISITDLIKIYKTKNSRLKALCDINLDIYPGEFVAVVGTSGSGKSTLLNLIAGLEKPSSGQIFIKGKPIHKMNESQLAAFRLENVGFIFQSYNLLNIMNAIENAAFPLVLRGVSKEKREKKAKELLKEMGLEKHIFHYPNELSGGQQQRVAIARALIAQPQIIFADEPTGNLDSESAQNIMDILQKQVRSHNTTLLMVTHDIDHAKKADRIIYISDGEITDIQGGK